LFLLIDFLFPPIRPNVNSFFPLIFLLDKLYRKEILPSAEFTLGWSYQCFALFEPIFATSPLLSKYSCFVSFPFSGLLGELAIPSKRRRDTGHSTLEDCIIRHASKIPLLSFVPQLQKAYCCSPPFSSFLSLVPLTLLYRAGILLVFPSLFFFSFFFFFFCDSSP